MPSFISITSFWSNLLYTIRTFPTLLINNLLDVLAVAVIVYYALLLVRETRALQLIKSIAVIFVVYFLANALSMITLKYFIGMILNAGLVFLVVLFQPELRRALEQIGRSKLADWGNFGKLLSSATPDAMEHLIDVLAKSCEELSASRTGALMVIEREIRLGDIVSTGTVIDAEPSDALLGNLFYVNTPLHDGALIIRDARLYAAGCFLPLSDNQEIARELGTRHRAALGMSEVSDAIVIVVSEETGAISVAQGSRLQRNLSPKNLRMLLGAKLLKAPEEKKRRYFGRSKEQSDEQ